MKPPLPLLLCAGLFATLWHSSAAWTYQQNGNDWTALGQCSDAAPAQSPIDLPADTSASADGGKVYLKYPHLGTSVQVYNNGKSIAMTMPETYKAGFGVALDEAGLEAEDAEVYRLWQVSFHAPSEHTLDGVRYPLEMQMVHQRVVGSKELAVVSVLFATGAFGQVPNELLDVVIGQGLPVAAWDEVDRNSASIPGGVGLDLGTSMQSTVHGSPFFFYIGSLTVPPCEQQVKHFVRKEAVAATPPQLEQFRGVLVSTCPPNGNYRAAPSWSTAADTLTVLETDGVPAAPTTTVVPGLTTTLAVTAEDKALVVMNPDFARIDAGDSDELKEAKTNYQNADLAYNAAKTAKSDAEQALRLAEANFNAQTGVVDRTQLQVDLTDKQDAFNAADSALASAKTALDNAIFAAVGVVKTEQAHNVTSVIADENATEQAVNVTVLPRSVVLPHGPEASPFTQAATVAETVVRVGFGDEQVRQVPRRLAPDLREPDGPMGGPVSRVLVTEQATTTAMPDQAANSTADVAAESAQVVLHLPIAIDTITNESAFRNTVAQAVAGSTAAATHQVTAHEVQAAGFTPVQAVTASLVQAYRATDMRNAPPLASIRLRGGQRSKRGK